MKGTLDFSGASVEHLYVRNVLWFPCTCGLAATGNSMCTVHCASSCWPILAEKGAMVCRDTLVSSSKRAAEVMSVVRLTTTGDSVMTSATLHVVEIFLA